MDRLREGEVRIINKPADASADPARLDVWSRHLVERAKSEAVGL